MRIEQSARQGILALLARYGTRADGVPSAPGWEECFVDDAVLTLFPPRPGRVPTVLDGRAAIERAFVATTASQRTTHVTGNVVVGLDGAGADVQSDFVRLDRVSATTVVVGSFGRYRDRAVPCPDGLWRLAAREIHLLARRPPPAAS